MAHIPPEIIQKIRDQVDIEQVISRSVRLKKQGKSLTGLCPFHRENSPSFHVSTQKQLFHCFGCQAGGDIFAFVMKIEGLDFPQAVRLLAKEAGIEIPKEELSPAQKKRYAQGEQLIALNERALSFYREQLNRESKAQSYLLEDRGLSLNTIQRFELGWAPDSWDELSQLLTREKASLEQATTVGLLGKRARDGKLYDRLRGRVVFPIRSARGGLIGFGARRADWVDKDAPKYLNSQESPVYDKSSVLYGLNLAKDEIRKSQQALLVEGYLDVIALAQTGFENAVAGCGTALTAKHAKSLKRLCREVVVLYDGDAAGQEATHKASALLLGAGLEVKVVSLPENEDPDSFARNKGKEVLQKLVDEAPSAIDFFLAKARAVHSGGGVSGTRKAVEAVRPLILAINDPLQRDVTLSAAARQLGIDARALMRHLSVPGAQRARVTPRPQRPQTRTNSLPVVETELLKMFLEDPQAVYEQLETRSAFDAFSNEAIRKAVAAAAAAYQEKVEFDAPRALEVMRESGVEDEQFLGLIRAKLLEELPENHDVAECVTRLLRRHKDESLRRLRRQIEQATDPEAAAELAREASRLMALQP